MIIPRYVGFFDRSIRPRTIQVKPSYPLGSTAQQLAFRGLSPKRLDAAHPQVAPLRGASYNKSSHQTPSANLTARARGGSGLRVTTLKAHIGETNLGLHGAHSSGGRR